VSVNGAIVSLRAYVHSVGSSSEVPAGHISFLTDVCMGCHIRSTSGATDMQNGVKPLDLSRLSSALLIFIPCENDILRVYGLSCARLLVLFLAAHLQYLSLRQGCGGANDQVHQQDAAKGGEALKQRPCGGDRAVRADRRVGHERCD
jgi:hypothetical protein